MSRDVCERWAVYSLEARIRARTTPAKIPDSVFPARDALREKFISRLHYITASGDCENGDVLF